MLPSQVRPENQASGAGTPGHEREMAGGDVEVVRGPDASEGNLISVLAGTEEDLKQEQGAVTKEPSGNKKSAWKLKIELLKLKKKSIEVLESKVKEVGKRKTKTGRGGKS